MRRLISLSLALMLLASLTACGEGGLSLKPGGSSDADVITPDEDGMAVGYEGDTLRTEFFDMKIENLQICDEYDGLASSEGYKFLAAELTLYNYTKYPVIMYDTDFEVVWDLDDDDAWAWPEYTESVGADGEAEFSVRSNKQIPVEFELGALKSCTGVLLYQVPEDRTEFIVAFYEVFEPKVEGGDPEYGDAFFVLLGEDGK